ncbi:hypothetical protein J8F10_35890 [Gemmata sp. G18]|uniref:Uncharacterized protein n=1 Tax=Gemmata palustris TaxID=2822762 RepID=A0ABS5C3T4_9BACT|nr:hypothetical protein [Gemmata palustris]MBP3960637.1 hypothetical protein [Gemmata palustris]
MTRFLLMVVAVLGTAGAATAQYPTQQYQQQQQYPPGGVMPNIYNPQNQPLSPYLNLLRGGNPGVNYYYGVRPGTVGGMMNQGSGAPFTAPGGNRTLFFPQLANAADPLQPYEVGPGSVLPPAGHAVVFGNTLGYFPSPFGNRGGTRSGLAGVGTSRPPAPAQKK